MQTITIFHTTYDYKRAKIYIHLAPMLRISGAVPLLPPHAIMACAVHCYRLCVSEKITALW